ncbi:MAG: D-alanine--D-alanine ligase [Alphaproteobacteria bacterium]|nr:D-alanine--D-alanine ligase [Alphaproteobacteria bacterium]
MSEKRHVAVLMGGWSAERPVSLVTGKGCAEALRAEGFRVTEIDVGRDIAEVLLNLKPDVCFNALHGQWGEDGCVQGLLEILNIPYTHSGVLASAVAMHKERTKAVYRSAGLPIVNDIVCSRHDVSRQTAIKPPFVIKPVNQGSSVGVFIIRSGDNRPPEQLTSPDWNLGDEVMVEEFVPGRELTVAVMDGKALAVTEIVPRTKFYDYDAKYAEGGSEHVVPAKLHPDAYQSAMDLAEKAHAVLGCRGISRTDFRYDDTKGEPGRLILLETNTQPGMTPTSLAPEQAAFKGISYQALCRWLVEDASCGR